MWTGAVYLKIVFCIVNRSLKRLRHLNYAIITAIDWRGFTQLHYHTCPVLSGVWWGAGRVLGWWSVRGYSQQRRWSGDMTGAGDSRMVSTPSDIYM